MVRFYDVDPAYINFLKQIEPKIPNISYSGNNKFVCGAVFDLNGIQYFAPVSHNSTIYRTSFGIYDAGKVISTVRLCVMFPAFQHVLSEKRFSVIRTTDSNYANLLEKEWRYCLANEDALKRKLHLFIKWVAIVIIQCFKIAAILRNLRLDIWGFQKNRVPIYLVSSKE